MASLVLINDGVAISRFPIGKSRMSIGRASDNDIPIDSPLVSKHHAEVEIVRSEEPGGANEYHLVDLDSTNRTFVNDAPIARQRLRHEDVVRIGLNTFKFIDEREQDMDATTKIHKSWIPGLYFTK